MALGLIDSGLAPGAVLEPGKRETAMQIMIAAMTLQLMLGTALHAAERLAEALIMAEPGDAVAIGAGRFELTDGLSLDVDDRREGPASNSGLFLTYGEQDRVALGVGKRPVAGGTRLGRPQLRHRVRGAGRFDSSPPGGKHRAGRHDAELGRALPDPAAAELLKRWIEEMR